MQEYSGRDRVTGNIFGLVFDFCCWVGPEISECVVSLSVVISFVTSGYTFSLDIWPLYFRPVILLDECDIIYINEPTGLF